MGILTTAQNKAVIVQRNMDGISARIAGAAKADSAQNVLAIDMINAAGAEASDIVTSHTRLIYAGFIPPNATDYANAPMGSIYDEFVTDSTSGVWDFVRWEKNAAGWIRTGGRQRVHFVKAFGSTDSQFDITKSGDIVRYTFDGTGTAPLFTTNGLKVGDKIVINSSTFNAGNNGTFTVVTVAATYFEVVNASGVAENNKVLNSASASMVTYAVTGIDDNVIVSNYAAATTITLPTAVGCVGKELTLKVIGAGVATFDGAGSETVDGIAAIALNPNESAVIFSDGANWLTKSSNAVGVGISSRLTKTTVSVATSGAVTLTPAQLLGGWIQHDCGGGNVAATLPLGADMVAAIPGCKIGTSFDFVLENISDAAETDTLTANTGSTIESGHTVAVTQNKSGIFRVVVDAAATIKVYGLGLVTN